MGDRVDLLTRLTGVTGQQAPLGSHGLYSAVLVVQVKQVVQVEQAVQVFLVVNVIWVVRFVG